MFNNYKALCSKLNFNLQGTNNCEHPTGRKNYFSDKEASYKFRKTGVYWLDDIAILSSAMISITASVVRS